MCERISNLVVYLRPVADVFVFTWEVSDGGGAQDEDGSSHVSGRTCPVGSRRGARSLDLGCRDGPLSPKGYWSRVLKGE